MAHANPAPLFVIVGAGASHDAASSWPENRVEFVRPPLVKDLFNERYREILARYPLAQSAAPEIRDHLRNGGEGPAVSLEAHLRSQYKDSRDPYDLRRFYSISLYLQDLIWRASGNEGLHFDHTDRLVTTLLRNFHRVCFITLNYDLILDQALAKLDPINNIAAYVNYGRWSLVKLHGSVNWGYAPVDNVSVDDPPADLPDHLSGQIHLGGRAGAIEGRNEPPRYLGRDPSSKQAKLFPALTVPVGEEDELVCPPNHLKHLDSLLQEAEELDLLILGYSAYDRTVIERIERSEKRIRSLFVVNYNEMTAIEVGQRLLQLLPDALAAADVGFAHQSFGDWCRDDLPRFASNHPAAI